MKEFPQIDFVITWVDDTDSAWRQRKAEFSSLDGDDRDERYRDWDLLYFWFRGVEKHAPWVRKIHFVTEGHLPAWLNVNHPKLNIVKHSDFIPKEFLPTFNSNVIELHMHKIPGLSDQFVYFNDDFFITRELRPTDFFEGVLPKDMLAFQPVVANPDNPVMSHLFLNDSLIYAKYFNKRENAKSQPLAYFNLGYPALYFCYNLLELAFPRFTGLYTVHGPSAFNKSTFDELWQLEGEALLATSNNKFRSKDDLNIYLFREWQKLSGKFKPTNVKKQLAYFDVDSENNALIKAIKNKKCKFTVINDANKNIDFERAKAEIKNAFEAIFPDKSTFEI